TSPYLVAMKIQSVAVFCGSKPGKNKVYMQDAAELGKLIAILNLKLIYGGGKVGLMGALADAALENGGNVMGIIPKLLIEWEQQHENIQELAVVPDMHTRKKMLFEMSDAAIILPGGFGTLDEMFEMLTWNQLKIHDKKIYILNSGGFYDHLQNHLRMMEREGFLYEELEERIIFCSNAKEVFNKID
ncbi:MAG: LOG family protein, partial [Flavitalea sp.]